MGNASEKIIYYIPFSPYRWYISYPTAFVLKSNVFGHIQQRVGFFTQSWGATNFTLAFPLSKMTSSTRAVIWDPP